MIASIYVAVNTYNFLCLYLFPSLLYVGLQETDQWGDIPWPLPQSRRHQVGEESHVRVGHFTLRVMVNQQRQDLKHIGQKLCNDKVLEFSEKKFFKFLVKLYKNIIIKFFSNHLVQLKDKYMYIKQKGHLNL